MCHNINTDLSLLLFLLQKKIPWKPEKLPVAPTPRPLIRSSVSQVCTCSILEVDMRFRGECFKLSHFMMPPPPTNPNMTVTALPPQMPYLGSKCEGMTML